MSDLNDIDERLARIESLVAVILARLPVRIEVSRTSGDVAVHPDLTNVQRDPPAVLIEWVRSAHPGVAQHMTSSDPRLVKLGWEKLMRLVGDPTTAVPPAVIAALVGALTH